ncbi:hypothetical protein ACEQ7L_000184 [Vibrio fluvialis]|uniref:hypothetical protein n=1 Tax=Vibrio fluvialis TaxID=676 RepID=UPI001EEA33E5|nr:hypothetical protein [Vibrio fluvialis]EGR4444538.1 hypothetical protein [Vibrio cholerae]EKO3380791.1 hypothetical protein [Vibrio fluvialis]MCG6373080.1 hypothetical protein [Vibrio fluvialis]
MKKENLQTIIDAILMISALGLIWYYSNGWVVFGLLIIANIYTRNSFKPLENELAKATLKLENLEAENNQLRNKIDFLLNEKY